MSIAKLFKPKQQAEQAVSADMQKSTANEIISELVALEQEKKLERPVDEYLADEKFAQLLQEFDTAAAVRIYDAERRADEALRKGRLSAMDDFAKRKNMPKPIRAASHAEPETDFSKMSSEDFAKLKRRIAEGK